MNSNLQTQIKLLKEALSYAESIAVCNTYIKDNIHVEYYTGVREEAIEDYTRAITQIMQTAVEISKKAPIKNFDQELKELLETM